MAGWREVKAKARDLVHQTFEVPAIYLSHLDGTPRAVLVRVHTSIGIPGEDFPVEMADRFEFQPRVIFRAAEVPNPAPRSFLIVSETEIYRLSITQPEREGFISTEASRMSKSEVDVVLPTLQAKDAVP